MIQAQRRHLGAAALATHHGAGGVRDSGCDVKWRALGDGHVRGEGRGRGVLYAVAWIRLW